MSDVDTTETEEIVDETSADDQTEPEGAEDLGDKGKKALDEMKAQRNEARTGLREWRSLAKELGVTDAQGLRDLIANAGKKEAPEKPAEVTETEPVDVDKLKREAALEATQKANDRILRSEVRAIATGKLTDPADALVYLDLSKFEVDDDGAVDEEEITDAITSLLEKKPYLGAAQGGKRFKGTGDGGAKPPKPSRPTSLSEAVSNRFSKRSS